MNEFDVKRLAAVLAIQAEIEGMKVANIERESQNFALAYGEKDFMHAAQELKNLSYYHNDQL